jgi:NAD(P)-dependent dehydrogenase (short-subunit alcohol dehydrogenase family)
MRRERFYRFTDREILVRSARFDPIKLPIGKFNAISPGAIDTSIIDAQAPTKEGADAIRASFRAATPLDRLGRPEEIAAAALFLASDDSSYVAGAGLVVDGGLSAL